MSHLVSDVIIAGGGLAGCLIAWRLAETQPGLRIALVEKGAALGGEHTWSFHGPDLTFAQFEWLLPVVEGHWPRQEVRFPRAQRVLETSYHSVRSTRLARKVREFPGITVLTEEATEIRSGAVSLKGGQMLQAPVVLDTRGAGPAELGPCGYQKFFGLDVELDAPHGLAHPVLMDALVPQTDGFRFFYLLPWTSTRLLIEETLYSSRAELDVSRSREAILAYAARAGWKIRAVEREEAGVLPIPLKAIPELGSPGVCAAGVRAGLFHYVTGYSLPWAVATAEAVARVGAGERTQAAVASAIAQVQRSSLTDRGYWIALNRMLFLAAGEGDAARLRIFERFYGLDRALIERFYRGELRWRDCLRIVAGKPPVPVVRALRSLFTEGFA